MTHLPPPPAYITLAAIQNNQYSDGRRVTCISPEIKSSPTFSTIID